MTKILRLKFRESSWGDLVIYPRIRDEVKEMFEKNYVVRWQVTPNNRIIMEVKNID